MSDFRDGALGAYLREIGDIPLLTRADEHRLGKRIKRGDRAAREQMIRASLRLVVKIATTMPDWDCRFSTSSAKEILA